MSNLSLTSVRGKEMMTYLPGYYATSRSMSKLIDSQGKELDELYSAVDDTFDQLFVSTATWGLEDWERELGVDPNPSKPLDQRRSVLHSKLRGIGTVTINLIQSVAEAYDGGTVEVTVEPSLYTFTVRFVDTLGIPPNLDDLKGVIEEIRPAHLAVEYSFTYLSFGDLDASEKTFGNFEATGITFGELEIWDMGV